MMSAKLKTSIPDNPVAVGRIKAWIQKNVRLLSVSVLISAVMGTATGIATNALQTYYFPPTAETLTQEQAAEMLQLRQEFMQLCTELNISFEKGIDIVNYVSTEVELIDKSTANEQDRQNATTKFVEDTKKKIIKEAEENGKGL